METDSLGWKIPDCSLIQAFKFENGRFHMEYKRDGLTIDVHIKREDLREIINSDVEELKSKNTCMACGSTCFHGLSLDSKLYPIHNKCYKEFIKSMYILQEDYASELALSSM